jgi:transposase, IS5 family
LTEKIPDHTYFCNLRKKIGTSPLCKLFNMLGAKLKAKGLVTNIFSFVDASSMICKVGLWDEPEEAIKDREETLNNKNIDQYAPDKDASYCHKGKTKYWYGHKRHVGVCMKNGLDQQSSGKNGQSYR